MRRVIHAGANFTVARLSDGQVEIFDRLTRNALRMEWADMVALNRDVYDEMVRTAAAVAGERPTADQVTRERFGR